MSISKLIEVRASQLRSHWYSIVHSMSMQVPHAHIVVQAAMFCASPCTFKFFIIFGTTLRCVRTRFLCLLRPATLGLSL